MSIAGGRLWHSGSPLLLIMPVYPSGSTRDPPQTPGTADVALSMLTHPYMRTFQHAAVRMTQLLLGAHLFFATPRMRENQRPSCLALDVLRCSGRVRAPIMSFCACRLHTLASGRPIGTLSAQTTDATATQRPLDQFSRRPCRSHYREQDSVPAMRDLGWPHTTHCARYRSPMGEEHCMVSQRGVLSFVRCAFWTRSMNTGVVRTMGIFLSSATCKKRPATSEVTLFPHLLLWAPSFMRVTALQSKKLEVRCALATSTAAKRARMRKTRWPEKT